MTFSERRATAACSVSAAPELPGSLSSEVFSRLIFSELMNELTNRRGFASLGLSLREKVNFHSIC